MSRSYSEKQKNDYADNSQCGVPTSRLADVLEDTLPDLDEFSAGNFEPENIFHLAGSDDDRCRRCETHGNRPRYKIQ